MYLRETTVCIQEYRVINFPMRIGYARVSTEDQSLDLQIAALEKAGCDQIYTDQGVSGASTSRLGLSAALAATGHGDVLVVWRLDRLGRSLSHLVTLVDQFGNQGIGFSSLTESIDTTTSGGMLMFHVMAALAQFERSLISERTRAGMAAARSRGQRMGRKVSLTSEQCDEARKMLGVASTVSVAERYNIHPRTLQRILRRTL